MSSGITTMSSQGGVLHDGDEVLVEEQLMINSCTLLLQEYFGEGNWRRWNQVKRQTEIMSTHAFVSWLLDLAEVEISQLNSANAGASAGSTCNTPENNKDPDVFPVRNGEEDFVILNSAEEPVVDWRIGGNDEKLLKTENTQIRDVVCPVPIIIYCSKDGGRYNNKFAYVCNICQATLGNMSMVQSHLVLRHQNCPVMMSCSCCDKTFHSVGSFLESHRAEMIGKSMSFVCHYCSQKLQSRQALADHINNRHEHGAPAHECPMCGKMFKYACNLTTHKKKCSVIPLQLGP